MNTAYNKAVVASIGALVAIGSALGWNLSFLTPETQAALASAITALLVYLIPNKPATPPAE